MDAFKLEVSQMLKEHPILKENNSYKCKYINVLEYFVRRFSKDDIWANKTLQLYKKALIEDIKNYKYEDLKLLKKTKPVVATKFKPFKFFSYRYCLIVDCVFLNAINNKVNTIPAIYPHRFKN